MIFFRHLEYSALKVVLFLPLIHIVTGLLCYVCIPPLAGTTQSQLVASKMRANISRTFSGKAESDFQECGPNYDKSQTSAQITCPWNDENEICLDINHASWQARTCGRIPFELDLLCYSTSDGQNGCPCAGTLCNSRAAGQTPVVLGIAALAALSVWAAL